MRWFIAAAFALFFAPGVAQAWGPVGHNTVCEIAWLDMTATTREAVDRLVRADGQFETFVRTCNYPDPPPERRRGDEHFANFRRTALSVSGQGCPTNPQCVIQAIVNDLGILRSPSASQAAKRTAIKFIGHWIGDIHQPLHISFKDDIGGNEIRATGQCSGHLHGVWDSCIINRRLIGQSPARFANRRDAVAGLHGEISPAERTSWSHSEPWQWAAESYEIALRPATGYCIRNQGACWYDDTHQNLGSQRRRVRIDPAYLDDSAPIVADRLKRAGVRLAHVLNLIFDPGYAG